MAKDVSASSYLTWQSQAISFFLQHQCDWEQTSSRLYKTVIDYDYDYFQLTEDDYDYIFTFARWITFTIMIIHFLKF